jgi:hypothetical protein
VVVDQWADLKINLEAGAKLSASRPVRLMILLGTLLMLAILAGSLRSFPDDNGRTPAAARP